MAKRRETEHEIQSQILDWLKLKGIFHWRNNTGAMKGSHNGKNWFVRFGVKGAPDIFVLVDGRFYGIEVKSAAGILSPAQESFAFTLASAGGFYILARSIEDVRRVLES